MSTRLVHLVVDAADPVGLARFWSGALAWPVTVEEPDDVVIEPPADDPAQAGQLPLVVVPVPEPKTSKNRVHLDVASTSDEHKAALVARLEGLGAHQIDIGQPDDVSWVVLADPEAIAAFWAAATGWPALGRDDQGVWLREDRGRGPWLDLHRVSEAKTAKLRVHLDLAPFSDGDHSAEVARLRAVGAEPIDIGQGDVRWTVLTDPEGNEFCVLTPR